MAPIVCYRSEAELGPRLRLQGAQNPGQSPTELLAMMRQRSPHLIAGPPDRVIEQVRAYGDAGVQELMVQRIDLDDLEGLQIIAEEVLPHVA
jgi:alkanesulfonate monooxygenase SsuD/methylene tetrahydromethanopterin reductase-like flavin-dependent oxidoreductase (luciferase family)